MGQKVYHQTQSLEQVLRSGWGQGTGIYIRATGASYLCTPNPGPRGVVFGPYTALQKSPDEIGCAAPRLRLREHLVPELAMELPQRAVWGGLCTGEVWTLMMPECSRGGPTCS